MVDHRELGRELELFCSDPLAGAGLPMWLPAGAAARHAVEEYVREVERRAGYRHVYSPPLGKRRMYELSGHLAHFADDMFPPMAVSADDELVLRPALCPHHALIFRSRGRSYRELPLRLAEIGGMYRAERSGVLGGLSRVRAISLNDAHNFCRLEQVAQEAAAVLSLIDEVHGALGVRPAGYRLSLRADNGNADGAGADAAGKYVGADAAVKYVGADADWDRAEAMLREALGDRPYVDAPGEAAFYGPKIDIQVCDAAGRVLTISTVQVDFHQPAAFDLSYVDSDGRRRRPVMVHRSLVGSMERLFAYLIEVHAGAFPVWFAPVQVVALPVGAGQVGAAAGLARAAVARGLRAEVAVEGSLGARVRDAARARIPYAMVVGEREAAAGEAALRLRDGRSLGAMPAAAALDLVASVAAARSPDLLP
jgi:threonyl-tRNA synthetase